MREGGGKSNRERESDVGRDSEGGIYKVERGFERRGVREGHTHSHIDREREGGCER